MVPYERLTHRGQVARLKRLAEGALPAWGLDLAAVRLTPLRHAENTTFRVDDPATGARWCLRIHRPGYQTAAAIRSELAWLAALRRDTDLCVPELVPLAVGGDGSDALLEGVTAPGVPEPRNVVLLRWVYGRFLRRRIPPSTMRRVGGLLARLHDHAAGFTPPPGFVRERLDADTFKGRTVEDSLAEAAPHLAGPGDADALRAAYARVRASLDALGTGPDAYGLIHADLHRANFVVGAKGEVRPIDFDDCGFGHFLTDLVVTYVSVPAGPAQEETRAALFDGYRAVRPLPEPWLRDHLAPLVWGRRFLMMRWFVTCTDNPMLVRRTPAFVAETVAAARALLDGAPAT
jgi:Ser/Thr protein kinase RdoA (MazF antagonist)